LDPATKGSEVVDVRPNPETIAEVVAVDPKVLSVGGGAGAYEDCCGIKLPWEEYPPGGTNDDCCG
jgi:hypothetical protein